MTPIFRAELIDGAGWVEGWVICNGLGTRAIIGQWDQIPVDVKPESLQQKISGKWLTMEQVGRLVCCGSCLCGDVWEDCAGDGGEWDGRKCKNWQPEGGGE